MYRNDPSAILRSRDRGKTWDIFPVNFRMGGNEDGRGVGERLAVDPNDNRILYFGSRHDGLMRSTDAAASRRAASSACPWATTTPANPSSAAATNRRGPTAQASCRASLNAYVGCQVISLRSYNLPLRDQHFCQA